MPYARRRNYNGRRRYGSRRTRIRRSNVGRRRFKRSYRSRNNNTNSLTMRAQLAARQLRVKLPWAQTFTLTMEGDQKEGFVYQGNGIVPYTLGGQTGTGWNLPAVGDILPAGEVEYSQFYDRYIINGSSISAEIIQAYSPNANPAVTRAILLAVPFIQSGDGDNWPGVRDQLNGYSYEQLLTWPHAKWRMVGINTGGSSRVFFKMFRKTKHMCGIKDLVDNNAFQGMLTDGQADLSTWDGTNPVAGFMYYLRFFNTQESGNSMELEVTIKMSLYCTLFSREFNPTQTIVAPPT